MLAGRRELERVNLAGARWSRVEEGASVGLGRMESLAVCELGPRQSRCTTLPGSPGKVFGLKRKFGNYDAPS